MRLSDDLADLPLYGQNRSQGPYHVALLFDPNAGPVLVDTGLPDMLLTIQDAIQAEGARLMDVRTVLITHHDLDHIGSLPELVEATGAQVLAAPDEVPFIQDGRPPQKLPTPEAQEALLQAAPEAQRDAMRAQFARMSQGRPSVAVTRALVDNEVLDLAGGVRVVFTPGHTVGHTSFYLERSGILIAGDALTAQDGQLHGPSERFTADLATAHASVRKLAALRPQGVLCYHGGFVMGNAAEQLERLAATLS